MMSLDGTSYDNMVRLSMTSCVGIERAPEMVLMFFMMMMFQWSHADVDNVSIVTYR